MAVKLDSVVPFGRSLDEYRRMFDLSDADLNGSILGVGDGPASFNAEAWRQGIRVTSVDPLYALPAGAIRQRFDACVDGIIAQVAASPEDWVWTYHQTPERLRKNRERAIERFLEDYAGTHRNGRYVAGELPQLPFPDGQFDLALCSHFLFLYSDQLSLAFHEAAIREMWRVAREVRVFPLLTLSLSRSLHLAPLMERLATEEVTATLRTVPYEFQRGGNEVLVLHAAS